MAITIQEASTSRTHSTDALPGSTLDADRMPGHWLLARLGKRVLRPGGVELTTKLLGAVAVGPTDDVLEVAPGLGATTRLLLEPGPASYTGVDRDPEAADLVATMLDGPNRRTVNASATDTGLPDASADVVFGEAYLTMQPDSLKRKAVAELARLLRPGGRFALHEIAYRHDDAAEEVREAVKEDLTTTIKVAVNPMTVAGWKQLLVDHGLEVQECFVAPLHLLEPRRVIADEGFGGALRFASRVARDGKARRRVLAMRDSMASHEGDIQAVGLMATKRAATS